METYVRRKTVLEHLKVHYQTLYRMEAWREKLYAMNTAERKRLAARIGCSVHAVQSWTMGVRRPGKLVIEAIEAWRNK